MKNMTLANIAAACNGRYIGSEADREREVSEVVIDSRAAKEGSLFVAIRGERVDAHRFIPAVFAQGALCVICEEAPESPAGACIVVESSLQAIKDIAEFYRKQLNLKVVGITGSVGKTSTKEIIASVLSEKYQVLKTQKNFNNELGLPLTVFRLREEHEIAVLEMGINHFGEMHRLSKIARPDVAVITNIGECHLEFLGDRDGVLRAKSEIFDFLTKDGTVILNGDDDKLASVKEVHGKKTVFYGCQEKDGIYADQIEYLGLRGVKCCIHMEDEAFEVMIPIPGYHMVLNALAAATVGHAFGLTKEEIARGIEKLETLDGRMHLIEQNGLTVIDDCYNANPVSMKSSLRVLSNAPGRKIAVLGDMGELGEDEIALHREVGAFAAEVGIDLLLCVGTLSKELVQEAADRNPKLQTIWAVDTEEALQKLQSFGLKEGDYILVKASHFMHFEKLVSDLTK
ncbi:MAG: UDP-N-acetylmuramoyl-tripeptide--D-alanyl-D-alanine ligase [Eubacteriales bacterium]|nr:UDP-N-acetylmuramoyl-tripeptide--D-alanyl-D-alanine ligase [Eubacteriales bacterium]